MNRVDRLFAILLLLQRKKRLRAQDIARAFEVSERTIYRDIAALAESGVPIVSLPGEGYELTEGYYLPPLLFSPSEAQALLLGIRMLKAHTVGRLASDADRALAKVTLVLPAPLREEIDSMASMIEFVLPAIQFDFDDPHLAALQHAIREHRAVWLRYHSYSRNETTERTIEPQRLTYANGAWYLSAYCRLRKDERGFRLARIDQLRLLDESFVPRQPPGEAEPQQHVCIWFDGSIVRWVRERQHYAFQREQMAENNSVVMHYAVDSLNEIVPWLLGWGANARPLEPPELREQIRSEVQKLLDFLT